MESSKPECAKCGIKEKICRSPQEQGPAFCPTLHRKEIVEKANVEYAKPDILEFARQASIQEAECYTNRGVKPYILHPIKPRVQETCEFAQKMGYKKLGIAFCAGLQRGSAFPHSNPGSTRIRGGLRGLQGWPNSQRDHRSWG